MALNWKSHWIERCLHWLPQDWDRSNSHNQTKITNTTFEFCYHQLARAWSRKGRSDDHCFSIIFVFSGALYSYTPLVFTYSVKLSFISHWLVVHLYLQLMIIVYHPKHVFQTQNWHCVSTSKLKLFLILLSPGTQKYKMDVNILWKPNNMPKLTFG